MSLGEYIGAGSSLTKGLYHLNGDSGDDSGNGNDGTDTDITYGLDNGLFGEGALFNGSSSGIAIPVNITGAMTISCRFMIDSSYTNSERRLVARDSGTAVSGNQFNLGINGSGRLRWAVNRTTGERQALYGNFGTEFTHSVRYNVVAIWSGATQLDIYVDGAYAGGATVASGTQGSFTQTYIGRRGNGGYWLGKIEEVIIENYARTSKEVRKYYTYAKGRFATL